AEKLPPAALAQTLRNPTAPMPSYANLAKDSPEKLQALVGFIGQLK
ncbi:MAG: hypothetical protein QOK31_1144, partial [Solirubrobacteraceae bacterium]|nr:hypothetical protein [Solirubrobacteraceae bacterium]